MQNYEQLLTDIQEGQAVILQLKAEIKYLNSRISEENLDKREAVSALAKTLEELHELSEDIKSIKRSNKKRVEELAKLETGIEVDRTGALWVLIEEFNYKSNAPTEDKAYAEVLRQFYTERERGKFYKMLTSEDIKNLLNKRGKKNAR